MTWGQFKAFVEAQGLTDEHTITMIKWRDYEATPAVDHYCPTFARIVQNAITLHEQRVRQLEIERRMATMVKDFNQS